MPFDRRAAIVAIALLALCTSLLARSASTRQSATFDEIVLVSAGVRGVTHGRWDMVVDQPPVMMWLYGWAAATADPALPDEARGWSFDDRWEYGRQLFFQLGNDPQRVLLRARAVTSIMAGLVVLAAAAMAWWAVGPRAGGGAAGFTALLPDVLAHGGIAYNDVPLALAFLLAVWALDVAVRRPGPGWGALAGAAVALAFGMKMSALALLPLAFLLVVAEAIGRWGEAEWRAEVAKAALVAGVAFYATLVVFYLGDVSLTLLRFNFWQTVLHATGGHVGAAFLLGRTSANGWWYYFPVAFLFKTPAAFQVALGGAAVVLARRWAATGWRAGALLAWRGRAPLLGVLVFGAFLLRSDLNVGFRYALPVLPLLAIVAAAGWSRAEGRTARVAICGLWVAMAVSTLSIHPHYLPYSSVWAGGRDRVWRVLSDSNVDWGQGLIGLRSFMETEGVRSVRLSYFGSARPEAYGIEFVALPGFFRQAIDRTPNAEASPRFTVISATNLNGLYFGGADPFATYREREPYRVLGHALLVYDDAGSGGT